MPRTPDPGALEYDLRGDHVARRRQPAYRTFMPTLRKSLGHRRSAYARLAGSTRIHLHQLSPGACSLVTEFGKERVPGDVVDRARQDSARKSFDVEVFHRDQPVAFHQPSAEIMMKGGSAVTFLLLPALCLEAEQGSPLRTLRVNSTPRPSPGMMSRTTASASTLPEP